MAAHSTADDTALARSAKSLCFPPAALRERACAAAVEPGAHTSGPEVVSAVLEVAAALGHGLFSLFSHPAPRVADGAAVVMRAIAGAARGVLGRPMRAASRA
jgi:DnaJ homolog subfamily C member 13